MIATPALTQDWADADLPVYLKFCEDMCIEDVTVPVTCWANESDNRTTAWNKNGNASGLCQLMPGTARAIGYDVAADPTLSAYRALSVSNQLDWVSKYYGPHAGSVATVARFYLCTFMPALLSHGDDMSYVICALGGVYSWAYAANKGFDAANKGSITVQDLVDAANRAVGPRTRELIARIQATVSGAGATNA